MAALGFDFVEWAVASNIGTTDQARFDELQTLTRSLPVTSEVWNILLPGDIKVVGPEADTSKLRNYLDAALPKVRALGGELIVFGSGRSRTVPENFDRTIAETQFREAIGIIADVAGANDLTIVLEPLRTGETNLINTVAEGLAVVEEMAHPNFELLADLYHMLDNGENLADVVPAARHLRHVHIATKPRLVPLEGEDVVVLGQFLTELKRAGYDERMSFECKSDDPDELRRGLEILRETWAAA
ncbi:MAG: sugar phosphate isomerase/epimerase family protein [Thermomicrobiales bacterium]